MIYIRPIFGLGNRMGAIASAVALARDSGERLTVHWNCDAGMHVPFKDVFEVPTAFHVSDFTDRNERVFSSENQFFYKDKGEASAERRRFIDTVLKGSVNRDVAVEAWFSFYKCDFSWVKPIASIQAAVDDVRRHFGTNCIGIHIRRTDNVGAIAQSPLSMFIREVCCAIKKDDNVRFFLATDDEKSKKILQKKFGPHIVTRENVAARFSDGGTQDALVDMLLLSATKEIIGSCGSTYSAVAAAIGGIELKVLCDKSWRVGPRAFIARRFLEWQHILDVIRRRGFIGSVRQFLSR